MKRYLLLVVLTFLAIGCNSSIVDDPAVAIHFSVPELSQVKLTIENSYDTQIAVLIDTLMQPGTHVVQYDASNLAEGIYFYTLKMTGESGKVYTMTKQYLLIK